MLKAAKSAGVTYMHFAMSPDYVEEWLQRDKDIRIFFQATDTIHLGRALTKLARDSKQAAAKYINGAE